ncbi:MAG: hypothetical protein AUJ20_12340 [Comamonadaceae bacterium CG1_02_60_18]|nr:MAG: hypothetical protein AUJ20_12340 [Comamonadaceae bacterium CG1_02_60_18]PIQ50674.1 MAG: hypothetical protein COW02_18845 [Comamonadaceae bacterium CG12_big_fil_rev_8_21_14_0_65_59_15]
MHRRTFSLGCLAVALALQHRLAQALSLDELSSAQASQGLRTALERGARAAVSELGRTGGFMGNDQVRIPLPGYLQDASRLLRALGQGERLDALVAAMNQAAEAAVALAKDMLVGAVKSMNIQDAKAILTGGETAVTQFFVDRTRQPLGEKFLPIVNRTTARVQLAQQYNQLANKASGLGLIKGDAVSIERYVTAKALDGLYFMIGEEEKKIRRDPVGTGSALLKKVFGVLQ